MTGFQRGLGAALIIGALTGAPARAQEAAGDSRLAAMRTEQGAAPARAPDERRARAALLLMTLLAGAQSESIGLK